MMFCGVVCVCVPVIFICNRCCMMVGDVFWHLEMNMIVISAVLNSHDLICHVL